MTEAIARFKSSFVAASNNSASAAPSNVPERAANYAHASDSCYDRCSTHGNHSSSNAERLLGNGSY